MNEESPILLTEDTQSALNTLVDRFELEGENHRDDVISECKKLAFFWEGFQYLTRVLENTGRYISPELNPEQFESDAEDLYYTKVINIHKAHGESIIAALSTGIPSVTFYPLNADSEEDKQTAEAYKGIAEIVQKHNKAKLLLIQAIWILYNQNFVAANVRNLEDEKYGTYESPIEQSQSVLVCPECKSKYAPPAGPNLEEGQEELPAEEFPAEGISQAGCPHCGSQIPGDPAIFTEIVGMVNKPKSRTLIDLYGPLNVYIPRWVNSLSQTPFLRLADDMHVAIAKHTYPEFADKIKEAIDTNDMERWGRLPVQVDDADSRGMTYRYRYWLRPCAYHLVSDEATRNELETNFPTGVKLTYVNGILVDVEAESLDEAWVVSFDPRASTLHADPVGRPVVPVQETLNDVFNLTTQTIEHGVPETFADPEVLNFDDYGNSRARPGQISKAKPRPGKTLNDGFYTVKTASVSQEIDKFFAKLEQLGQFVVGSFPSIYGGQMAGSRTAAEYSMSRQQALQRLSTTWAVVTDFWTRTVHKAANNFAQNLKSDEFYVSREGNTFINMWVYQAHLNGSVGEVEPESSEQLPVSSAQKKDELSNLMQLNSQEINAVLTHPQNALFIKTTMGLPELYIPGAFDREKQLEEIDLLLKNTPMGEGMSSIPPDEELDNHELEAETCREFLLSRRGRLAKQLNPEGYQNVLFHMKAHQMITAQRQQPAMAEQGNQNAERQRTDGSGNPG